eukprot:2985281-Amphidinium_carterae.1
MQNTQTCNPLGGTGCNANTTQIVRQCVRHNHALCLRLFLFVEVSYAKLDGKGEVPAEMSVLIETGLVHPQGIAVDAMRTLTN